MTGDAATEKRRGRPDHMRKSALQAAAELNCFDRYPTLREIIRHARLGQSSGRYAVQHLRSGGWLLIVSERRESYRNRPVAEYAVACPLPERTSDSSGFMNLAKAW